MREDESKHHSRYIDTIQDFKDEGYYSEPITLTSLNTYLVTTFSVQKGTFGKTLELICPAGRIITICGSENSSVVPGDFARAPHLFSIPHQFSIRCFNKDNVELSPLTSIRIERETPSSEIYRIDDVLYGDLSLTYGERFKRKEERYYFSRGIVLYGGEYLCLTPVQPDIDIVRTELFMKCDFLTQEIKS